MSIVLYNTLTKTKDRLTPRHPSNSSRPSQNATAGTAGQAKIQMFVCGPTVYDYIHIGNARTFVFFDVVAKYLRHKGFDVNYIQNITDIDDKIINKAAKENKTWKEIAEFYFEEFKKDTSALGITSPNYIKATDKIDEVKKQVKKLIEKENVYLIESDGWYFDLKTFPEYGKLSGRTVEMADDAVSRIDKSNKKRNKGDFCVWKLADPEPSPSASYGTSKSETGFWEDEELGYGRPGWHIEDTAITDSEFGPQYDIHGGGQDLIFPHHEAEIAQQESVSGLKPFVKYWMHIAFLVNKEEKMSKSLGNFTTTHELLEKYSKEVLRFYLLSGYYRSPLEFSDKILKQSKAAIQRIAEFKKGLELARNNDTGTNRIDGLDKIEKEFFKKMADDFNTPEALGQIFNLIRQINPIIKFGLIKKDAELVLEFISKINDILGIIPIQQEEIPTKVQELVEKREKFREEKNYEESDKIRTQIQDLGWEIEDTIYGPLINKN